jgi:hypothetical protein
MSEVAISLHVDVNRIGIAEFEDSRPARAVESRDPDRPVIGEGSPPVAGVFPQL